jgi:hypothetical protein
MNLTRTTIATACACSIFLESFPTQGLYAQDTKTNIRADTSASATGASSFKSINLGEFAVTVPTEWATFNVSEAAALRRQYLDQSKQIYQQFNGADDPTKSVDIAAFHILNDVGSFVIVSFTVPPQSNLIDLLKSQVGDKMNFGVRQGYIRRYLGMTSVNEPQLSGFYTTAIGTSGNVEVSGGLEHKKLKNTVIQLTLLAPKGWDETRATNSLTAILRSVVLRSK